MPSRSDTRTHSTRGMGGAWHFHFLTVRRPSYKLVPVESATPLVACLGRRRRRLRRSATAGFRPFRSDLRATILCALAEKVSWGCGAS